MIKLADERNLDPQEYKGFKSENWWAKNEFFPLLTLMLYFTILLYYIISIEVLTRHTLEMIVLGFAGGIVLMLALAISKYFLHDKPLWLYMRETD